MNRRTLTTTALACLAGVFATTLPQPGFSQSNPLIGTWKINLTKSKFSPGPAPKSSTLIFEAVGQGFRATNENTNAQDNTTKSVFGPYSYDGKSYPITGVPSYDASSYKIVNDTTVELTRTKAGKVVQTGTRVLSGDGKTVTFTMTGVNANGQQVNDVIVYDKQ
jgi:hypothetical protein